MVPVPARAEEFDSFGAFLDAKLKERRERSKALTLRQFARACRMAPAAVSMLLHGKRLPSPETLESICRVLKVGPDEETYLRTLVAFARAESPEDRRVHRETLAFLRALRGVARADEAIVGPGRWYYAVIPELATLPGFQGEPRWICEKLQGRVHEADVRVALDALVAQGVLVRAPDGSLSRGARDVELPGGNSSAVVRAFHADMLGLALDSLGLPVEQRFVSGLTLTLNAAEYSEFTEEILRFLRSMMLRATPGRGDRVYQLQVQFFPHTAAAAAPATPDASSAPREVSPGRKQ